MCLLVCLLVCLFVGVFVCLCVCLFVCSFGSLCVLCVCVFAVPTQGFNAKEIRQVARPCFAVLAPELKC